MTKVKSIEYVGEEEQQCIEVNSKDHLYITDSNIVTSNTIVTGTMTEITFFKDAGRSDQYIFNFFSKLRTRIESRMKGNYFGRFLLDSSPNNLESPIDDWVVHDAPKNSSNYIIRGARWDYVKSDFPEDTFDERGKVKPDRAFQVFVGGKGRPPSIIDPSTRGLYSPEDVIDVPNTFQMRDAFEENVYESLKDIAGIPAGTADKIFYDPVKVEKIFEPKLKNIYTHIHAMSTETPEGLIWNQVKDILFTRYVNSYRFWRMPHVPRVFAVDQSISGDAACLSVMHVERDKEDSERTINVVDFSLVIVPGGGRINLDAIRFFIEDLREKGGMNFVAGSFDQFQSEATFQYLLRLGFNVEKLSVDKLMDPYLNFISIVESGRLRAGQNLHLKNNIKSLQIVKRKSADGTRSGSPKVDHTSGDVVFEGDINWETSAIGIHAKDAADTVCACCELLRKNNVLAYEVWDPENIKTKTQEDMKDQLTTFLKSKGLAYSDTIF